MKLQPVRASEPSWHGKQLPTLVHRPSQRAPAMVGRTRCARMDLQGLVVDANEGGRFPQLRERYERKRDVD